VDSRDLLDPTDFPEPPDPRVMWDPLGTQHRFPRILDLTAFRSELGISKIPLEDPSSFKRMARTIPYPSRLLEELKPRGT
jgi:hypothetical protein